MTLFAPWIFNGKKWEVIERLSVWAKNAEEAKEMMRNNVSWEILPYPVRLVILDTK